MDNTRSKQTWGVLAAAMLLAAPGVSAQSGSIAGRIMDAQSGQTIPAAQVFIADLDIGVLSQQNGSYILLNVPAGNRAVTVQRIGYGQITQNVVVAAGQTAVLDFRVAQQALQLDEVVVTGTAGGTARRALGNSVEVLSASTITEQATITNIQGLMAGRTPGVRFGRSDGQVGGGSPITIRGVTSTLLGSQPLIYVDGIRIDNDPSVGPDTGSGNNASALNDLNPDDIESIEVIKGPSAATLYGTEASAGVIQIITKRGSVGAPEFEFEVSQGTNFMRNPADVVGTTYGCRTGATVCPESEVFEVNLYDEANHYLRGTGRFATVDQSNPLFADAATFVPQSRSEDLLQNGSMQRYNMSVRGGVEQVRYYVGATWTDEVGVVDYNTNNQASVRANLTVLFGDNVNVDISTGYSQGKTRFATVDNEGGSWHQIVWGRPNNLPGARIDNPATATVDESLGVGFLGFQERWPIAYEDTDISRDYNKFTGSMTTTHRFGGWFSQRLTFGLDRGASTDNEFIPGRADFPAAPFGQLTYGRPIDTNITFDYSTSARYAVTESFGTNTSFGAQYYARYAENVIIEGINFPTAVQTVIDQTEITTRQMDFSSTQNKTLGFYIQEELSWEDRIFLTAAVRGDDNSAFGSNFELQYYPKLSGSWVVSEEAFWNVGFINSLRLRSAWGKSGRQPGTFASQTLFTTFLGPDGNGLIPATAGNPDIGPEVSTEIEMGFDVAFLDDRLSGQFSYYRTKTEDMLVNQSLAPTTGLTGSRQANLGTMESWGWEASMDARLYQGEQVAFDLTLSADYTTNEITSLGAGILPTGNFQIGWPFPNIASAHILRFVEMNAAGTNANTATAICDGGQPAVSGGPNIMQGGPDILCDAFQESGLLLGPSYPNYTFHVAPTLTLFQDLQIFALAEGQYGRWIASVDAQYACGIYRNCRAGVVRNDPYFLAGNLSGAHGDDRYQGRFPADFWKLRQVGLRYSLPADLVGRMGADRASFSVSANNLLRFWQKTKYDLAGNPIYDPEYTVNGSNPQQTALWEMPGIASISATFRVTF
ncbi:MAG: SusC/RagA family TonB-linked outer membrane protein [Gemmatimonadota bacterium]